ncbi:hypothetical protein H9Y05_08890 [Crocinitomicaceae bacterium CZZ-1]|uniref:Uncharacterized protein n=1 Tax=Taishania pollutisoli TaxID=2766479 RepID=A0A8J6PJ58_9FLAO|nr:hypothetical protein [Taishania pollutisoli]MBC9812584.1 hypothetical protein [Taishania pollutisoli]
MVKFINILLILLVLLACKKKKFESDAYAFILGEWEWKLSIASWSTITNTTGPGSYYLDKIFVRKGEISEYCRLRFTNNGKLTITTQEGEEIMKLKPHNVIQIGNNRIVQFKTNDGAIITFSYSAELNQLDTEYSFFSFPAHPCNTGFLILNSSYEKN